MIQSIPTARVARTLAGHLWGTAYSCERVCKGVYRANTASHGGYLAFLVQCELSADAIDAAESAGLVDVVAVVYGRRTKIVSTAQGHSREVVLDWLRRNRERGLQTARFDVAIFEEDCDWAALALLLPETVREAPEWNLARTLEYARDIVSRYGHLAPFARLLEIDQAEVMTG